MKFTITLWSSPDMRADSFVEAITKHAGLSFSTAADGGFTDCSFEVGVSGWNAVKWYRSYIGKHVVIFDHLGRAVYEGRVEDTESSFDGVKVTCLGYYSHKMEVVDGLVYPASTPTTGSDIIKDAINIARDWNDDTSMVQELLTDITPQDFSVDKKLSDAISAASKYGNDAEHPKPMYFAIWENRRAYFYEEPDILKEPDWRVLKRDFASSSGITLSRSRSDVWNKVQVRFDDPDIGTTFTEWAQDYDSQKLFGIREGTLNAGSTQLAVAEVVRDLALASYAYPDQSSKFDVCGRVYSKAGAPDYSYMVRGGQQIRVMDFDPSVAQQVGGSSGLDSSVMFVSRTTYDADKNTLRLELGRQNVAFDLLMARLGLTSGSIS